MKTKPKWLDRRIAAPGPYLTLCLGQAEFRSAIAGLKPPEIPNWIMSQRANATTHFFVNQDHHTCAVVCLGEGWRDRNSIEVAGLLVHEAVHVWQAYCDDIGERNPGSEQEAYGIQSIAQELLAEFARRL
jgi:hypothetical protein